MIYMLDTNILIYLIKNKPPSVAERVDNLQPDDELCMSFISYAELLKGAERSTRKTQVLQNLARLIAQIPVIYPEHSAICQHYAQQFNHLKNAGTPIGANDLWIACHALAINAILVTHNTKEFTRITDLVVEDWVSS